MGKMRYYGTNGKDDGKMEGIPVDLDERSVKTVEEMGDYVSMGQRLVLRGTFCNLCIFLLLQSP